MPEHPPHTERSTVAVMLRLAPAEHGRLRAAAVADDRPVATYVKRLIRQHLDQAERETPDGAT